MPSPSEITIIGRGLAGAVMVEVLRERGVQVRVVDRPIPGAASTVAAGIVNPVVLRRIVPSWRAAELLPIAEDFYQGLEQRYRVKLSAEGTFTLSDANAPDAEGALVVETVGRRVLLPLLRK